MRLIERIRNPLPYAYSNCRSQFERVPEETQRLCPDCENWRAVYQGIQAAHAALADLPEVGR